MGERERREKGGEERGEKNESCDVGLTCNKNISDHSVFAKLFPNFLPPPKLMCYYYKSIEH